jgi:DNA-binding MarR family transcriptional regulator
MALSQAKEGRQRAEVTVAMDSLRRFVRALRTQNEAAEREYGVTAAQLFVLRQIAIAPGQSLGAVAERTAARQSSVSEVISRLVSLDFVERATAPGDRRRIELRLTSRGERVVRNAPPTLQERLIAGLETLSPEVRRALAGGLEAWLIASGLGDVPSTFFLEPDSP